MNKSSEIFEACKLKTGAPQSA